MCGLSVDRWSVMAVVSQGRFHCSWGIVEVEFGGGYNSNTKYNNFIDTTRNDIIW